MANSCPLKMAGFQAPITGWVWAPPDTGMPTTETDLLVVGLPDGPHPLPRICKALLIAEINIDYAYPILVGPQGQPALALRVDDHETAVNTLRQQRFTILTGKDFES
jgi:hypothetical protein